MVTNGSLNQVMTLWSNSPDDIGVLSDFMDVSLLLLKTNISPRGVFPINTAFMLFTRSGL